MRYHDSWIVGDEARQFFQEKVCGPALTSLTGRQFEVGSIWLGRDDQDRWFVALNPLMNEPYAVELSDPSPDAARGALAQFPSNPMATGLTKTGLLQVVPMRMGLVGRTFPEHPVVPGATQQMSEDVIHALEEFTAEEQGHFDPKADEPIEFLAVWEVDGTDDVELGYWAGYSPRYQDAKRIHMRKAKSWIPVSPPSSQPLSQINPAHWRTVVEAVDRGDYISDTAIMLAEKASSAGGFLVSDLPSETAESLRGAYPVGTGDPGDPLAVFLSGRAELMPDLLLDIILDHDNGRRVELRTAQPEPEPHPQPEPAAAPTRDPSPESPTRLSARDEEPPHTDIPRVDEATAWTALARYAVELAGSPHLLEAEACSDRDCAIFHSAVSLMERTAEPRDENEDDRSHYWTDFAIRELLEDALRSLSGLRKPFSYMSLEAPPGPYAKWVREWVPPIRQANNETLQRIQQLLAGLYALKYPTQGNVDVSEDALTAAGFTLPAWRDPLDDY